MKLKRVKDLMGENAKLKAKIKELEENVAENEDINDEKQETLE